MCVFFCWGSRRREQAKHSRCPGVVADLDSAHNLGATHEASWLVSRALQLEIAAQPMATVTVPGKATHRGWRHPTQRHVENRREAQVVPMHVDSTPPPVQPLLAPSTPPSEPHQPKTYPPPSPLLPQSPSQLSKSMSPSVRTAPWTHNEHSRTARSLRRSPTQEHRGHRCRNMWLQFPSNLTF